MVKKLWRYVKPFSSNTGRSRTNRRTDGRTDGQICYINIARQYMLTHRASVCWRAIKSLQMCAELRHCQRWVTNRKRQRVPQWRTRDGKTWSGLFYRWAVEHAPGMQTGHAYIYFCTTMNHSLSLCWSPLKAVINHRRQDHTDSVHRAALLRTVRGAVL